MRTISCLLLGAFLCTGSAYAQLKGGVYTDQALGVKLRIPKGWTEIPLKEAEEWVAAKFLSNRSYLSKDREWNYEHKPFMRMVVFTDEARKLRATEISKKGEDLFVRWGGVPYQGYEDFLKRNLRGYFISKQEEGEVDGVKCTMFEVQVHKATPKLRLLTWVFHGESLDVAVEFEVLEDRVDKIATMAKRSLSSFRFLDAPAELAGASSAKKEGGKLLWITNMKEWRKKSAADRELIRKAADDKRMDAVIAGTPDTWNTERSKSFLVVSHADKRFTKLNIQAAEAFREWCEKHFGELSDDYPRQAVLRICKDWDEYKAYQTGNSSGRYSYSFLSEDYEVVTYRDGYNGTSGSDAGFTFQTILDAYIQDKDRDAYSYMPLWLKLGLNSYVSTGRLKGKKLEFPLNGWMQQRIRDELREGKMRSFREIITMDQDQFIDSLGSGMGIWDQSSAAVRFILEEGRRHKPLKDFLQNYLGQVSAVVDERSKSWESGLRAAAKTAQTEEEEEEQRKNLGSVITKHRSELQAALNEKMFDLSDKEWARIDRAFTKFIK